jgi:hypothetical protein
MALTPTQLGTKSRTISAPNPNIRTRPNGLGRSPKMGRVQQLAPYQLGELVETPIGLRRIKGVSPITINVDLGPRSTLTATVESGATSLTVNSFKLAVELNVDDVLIVGKTIDSYRETVKVSSTVTTSTTGTTTISLSSGFKNSHSKGDTVIIQKLPPGFEGEFVEIEELKILGEDSYAYIIPSVPKSPRYIGRTGDVGNDEVKNEERFTALDSTKNFTQYEAMTPEMLKPLLDSNVFPAVTDFEPLNYQLYLLGFNSDGTQRTIQDRTEPDDPLQTGDDTKDPMVLTVDILEKGSAEHQSVEAALLGSYTAGAHRAVRFNMPSGFQAAFPDESDMTILRELFARTLKDTMFNFNDPPDPQARETFLLPNHVRALGMVFFFSPQTPDDVETDAQRTALGLPTRPGFACAANSGNPPPFTPMEFLGAFMHRYGGEEYVYIMLSTNTPDAEVALNMHCIEQITGTVSATSGSKTVTGVGTQFTSELAAGVSPFPKNSVIRFEGFTDQFEIDTITNDTTLTLKSAANRTLTNVKGFTSKFTDVPVIKGEFLIFDPNEILNQQMMIQGTSTAGKDTSGFISGRVFMELPRGQPRWSSKKALDNGKGDITGFVDAFQSPEDQPNETFGFYVGKNEESLPFMKMRNDTGETVLDGRVKLTGYIFDAPRVEAQELKKIRQRSGFYKARVFPHTGFFPKLEDRPDGPPEGWEPRAKTIQRTLTQTLKDLSMEVKKQMRD